MATLQGSTLEAIQHSQAQLREEWTASLETNGATRNIKEQVLAQETQEFLQLLVDGLRAGGGSHLAGSEWEALRRFLEKLSASRAQLGHDSHQAAFFIFALKGPLFGLLQAHYSSEPARLAEQLWLVSELLDGMGMHTIRAFQKTREEVIRRQQEELLELSTPVVKLWDGVLALPLIGTLDSQRSQTVMESLLQRIVDTGSEIAIRLMGADCIISGVRPQIAQTIVHLGLDLGSLTTKASLADALKLALARLGCDISKQG